MTEATIQITNLWSNVEDTSLTISIDNELTLYISYAISVVANKAHRPGGDFLGQPTDYGSFDFLGTRIVIDGVPYRQSGSHISPDSSLEATTGSLAGSVVAELNPGTHTISLQWKKWGDSVRAWTSKPSLLEGYSSRHDLSYSYRLFPYTSPLFDTFFLYRIRSTRVSLKLHNNII
jgi:hypothetical protein